MKVHIVPVSAENPHDLFGPFTEALDVVQVSNGLVRAGFAYATVGGVQHFMSEVQSAHNWLRIRKHFLIGIHHAITEPFALETLRNTANAQVRAFIPGARLRMEAFHAKPVFHPKVLAICEAGSENVKLLQAGSTNLTSSAIGKIPKNHEFSVAIQAGDQGSVDGKGRFGTWWSSLWNQARVVDRRFIRSYAELRRKVLDQNPILWSAMEAPTSIKDAEYFFSEVGAGSGPPGRRHQIEFPGSLASYFGELVRYRRAISLRRDKKTWTRRPLSYKTTTFGVEIWRLGMPTQHTGGDPIAGRAIQFKRTPDDQTFEFQVVDTDSKEFNEWNRLANIGGHLGATHGQRARQYGFY